MLGARNYGWKTVGLGLGVANAVRHRAAGYRTPRVFPPTDVARAVGYAQWVVQRWLDQGLDPEGRHILELGPGNDLGTGLLLVAKGAASYTAVDRFDLLGQTDPSFNRSLADACGIDLDQALAHITYRVTTFPAMADVSGPFDTFLSSAALEHFDDVGATFARLAELSAPAAFHCHLVDAKTHMRWVRERDPWNLLRYSKLTYKTLLSYPGSPNRLLATDFLHIVRSHGVDAEVRTYEDVEDGYLDWARPGVRAAFRGHPDDLNRPMFWLVGNCRERAAT